MAYQYPLNGGRINATIGGNTAGAGSLVSTGTLSLVGGNNVTLSQNGNAITISAGTALSTQSNQALSGSNGSFAFQTATFGNSNGLSFYTTNGSMVGSYTVPTQTAYSFSNANGVSFGTNGSTVTATVATTYAASNHSHGNPTLNLTNISGTTASASNGLTLSLSAGAQTAQTIGLYATGANTTGQSSSNTLDARSFSISAQGGLYAGMSGNTLQLSAATTYAASNHSHGNPTLNLTNLSGTTASASNGLTLSLSAASQSVQTQSNIQGIIASGSTNRTGDISFANSNGVTFGLSNNTVTASVAAGAGGGVALYDGVNSISSGTARVSAGGALTASVNGQTLSLNAPAQSSLSQTGIVSISRNGSTISIGAPAFSAGISTNGNTLGTSGTASNQIIFAGGNNITLSQSTDAGGNTISIIGGAGGGGGVALYDGVNSISSGTARVSAGGALTASVNGQTLSLNAPAQSNLSATGIVSISNNGSTISIGAPAFSAGIASNSTVTNQVLLTAGNNISLSQSTDGNGATIAIHGNSGGGGGGGTATMWYPYNEAVNVVGQIGQGTLGFAPVPTPSVGEEVQVDKLVLPLYFSNSSNSTGSLTVSFWMGLYTRTLSSISLAHSTSATASLGYAGNNSSSNQRGIRLLGIDWATTIDANRYIVGMVSRSTTAGTNASLSQVLISQMASNVSGMWDAATNASVQWPMGVGFYSATTSGLPDLVAYSQIRGTNSLAARPPSWHMINGTA